jgi:hypothetical protein
MRRYRLAWLLGMISLVLGSDAASAFGGMYVAKADGQLFNQSSKVVFARHDGRTVITMASDYQGALEEFALVVPVPDVLERGQIRVMTDGAVVDHLDAYTAPRLIKRVDGDPCRADLAEPSPPRGATTAPARSTAEALGVSVAATYAVGEYDIEILAAEDSNGLAGWLRANGYRLPDGAEEILADYVARGMRFILARVNLEEQSKLGYSYLRPLQMAFESEDFVLPLRLGMANAAEPQELVVYVLTRDGRAESVNYPTQRVPSGVQLPLFVKDDVPAFYRAMLEAEAARTQKPAVFLEYAWELSRCDPCTAEPLSLDELRGLGVFWLFEADQPEVAGLSGAVAPDVFVTRLHLRYDAGRFPDELRLRESGDRSRFQVRYALRHPWRGEPRCEAAREYLRALPARFEEEAGTLARLTGWPIAEIRARMEAGGQSFATSQLLAAERKWWERLWSEN